MRKKYVENKLVGRKRVVIETFP